MQGTVTSVDRDREVADINYEDGDSEEMLLDQIERLVMKDESAASSPAAASTTTPAKERSELSV